MKRLSLAVMLTALPVMAEEPNLDSKAPAQPGAVATYLSAMALYDQGVAAQDPLMVLTAARMMRGLAPAPRPISGGLVPIRTEWPAEGMFGQAQELDAGGAYSDLIEILSRETPPAPRALRLEASALEPAKSRSWTLQFYGGTYAELAVRGNGKGNLDFAVADAAGQIICQDRGNGDTAYCGFVALENGDFTVTVTNAGSTTDAFSLITN